MRCEFDAFGANLQLFFVRLWGPVIFFLFQKPNLGPSGDSGWVAKPAEDLSKGARTAKTWSRWRFSETWAPNAFLAAWSPLSHWSQMARYLRRFELQQSQAWAEMQVSVGLCLRMYGYLSLHTNVKARESSKNTLSKNWLQRNRRRNSFATLSSTAQGRSSGVYQSCERIPVSVTL